MSSAEEEYKKWFDEVLRLPQYYDKFIAGGYDDLSYLDEDINEDELINDIGIKAKPHRRKILKEIKKLVEERKLPTKQINNSTILPSPPQQANDYQYNGLTTGESDDIKGGDELSQWLIDFGLTEYESGLRNAGLNNFQLIKTMDNDDIKYFADKAGMQQFHIKAFMKAVSQIRDSNYGSNPGASKTPKDDPYAALRASRKHLKGQVERKKDRKGFFRSSDKKIRTVIFIGQTGAGKTTLINSMINYLHKVSYDEPFRYELIVERKDNTIKKNQTKSQTREITQYYLRDLPAINHSLNVIDTPGFGDTEGPQRDMTIRYKFKQFFQRIDSIDGIYFVVKASDTRLGATQKYIFNMVLDLFGEDVKNNIFILFTFSDGDDPPALKCVKELKIPFAAYFQINNSGFKLKQVTNRTHKGFFELGMEQFEVIFQALGKVQSTSIQNTRETLQERENITTWLFNIGQDVKTALDQIDLAHQTYEYLQANKDKADANEDFKIPDSKVEVHKDPVTHYTTYCAICVNTCHRNCGIPDDNQKRGCSAMDGSTGMCRNCTNKCAWHKHKNMPFVIRRETVRVWKTKKEMAEKYHMAKAESAKCEDIMKRIMGNIDRKEKHIRETIVNMRKSVNRLQEIALNKKILTDDEYFDTLIDGEKEEGRKGWQKRVKQLESMKRDNKLLKDYVNNNKVPISWKEDKDLIKYQKEFAKSEENKKQTTVNINVQQNNFFGVSLGPLGRLGYSTK